MSLPDARRNLTRVAYAGESAAFCTEEGRRSFRRAVRAFTAAYQAERGPAPPPIFTGEGDDGWMLVLLALFAGVAQESDVAGPMHNFNRLFMLQSMVNREVGSARTALREACPELIDVYRATMQARDLQTNIGEDPDNHRTRAEEEQIAQRSIYASQRLRVAMERLKAKLKTQGNEIGGSVP